MPLFVEALYRVGWAPNSNPAMLGQFQANVPGQGQVPQNPRTVLIAQVRQYPAGEPVPVATGSEGSVTLANIKTAIDACGTDVAGSTGTPVITPAELAIIQGWATGGP